jgi:hypothetical protein
LEAIGFLQRTETPQWVRNRYGQKMTINLQWDGTAGAAVVPSEAVNESAPPPTPKPTEITPPDSYTKLLPEEKHQKPASGGPIGVLSTLFVQARECVRNSITLLEEPPPVPQPTAVASKPAKQLPLPARKTAQATSPHLQHVLQRDLQDMDRLLVLYAQAVRANLIGPSEAEHLVFVALAQHVLGYHPTNPGGLFVQLLRQRRFDLITQEEEDRAQERLTRHCYADIWAVRRQATG